MVNVREVLFIRVGGGSENGTDRTGTYCRQGDRMFL